MSAYIVEKHHIIYLLAAATSPRLTGNGNLRFSYYWNQQTKTVQAHEFETLAELGTMLWRENVASVAHRYSHRPDELPGADEPVYEITIDDIPAFYPQIDPVQVFKSIACYAYQTCEHDGWKTSEAHAFCEALRGFTCVALTGYDKAIWGAPELKRTRNSV